MAQHFSPSSQPDSSSQSNPSLSRNSSLSRLNAQAPAFVPTTRPSPRPDLQPPPPPPKQSPRILIPSPPPPPPPALMRVYPPPPPGSPFHVVRNHHFHHHQHHRHHHHSHHAPVLYRPHNPQFYADNGGFHDPDAVVPQPQKPQVESDYAAPPRTKLTEEVSLKLLNQVEYYFSDLNLATTDHLMRFINKDPDGYVPISVVASFKKIKALINSHSQLANILRNSSKLMVNEDGKKVRRKQLFSESDMEELQSRIVIAENLPEDHCHQNLMKIFSAVGSVKNIRTCQPQISDSGASSTSKSAKADGMHYSNKLHAFVEYESVELAEKAVAELNEGNWRNALRLRLMLTPPSKSAPPRGKKGHNGEMNSKGDDTSEQPHVEKHVDYLSDQADVHPHEQREEQGNDKDGGGQRRGRNRLRGKGRGRPQYHHNHNNNHGNHMGTTPPSSSLSSSIEQTGTVKQQPPGPRMPDGTRGFAMGRGKPVTVNMA